MRLISILLLAFCLALAVNAHPDLVKRRGGSGGGGGHGSSSGGKGGGSKGSSS
ncbi:hypothetical protein LPJ75_003091, partial [Coemansia sp. RSA 2598]